HPGVVASIRATRPNPARTRVRVVWIPNMLSMLGYKTITMQRERQHSWSRLDSDVPAATAMTTGDFPSVAWSSLLKLREANKCLRVRFIFSIGIRWVAADK